LTHRDATMLERLARAFCEVECTSSLGRDTEEPCEGPVCQYCVRVVRAILNELKQVDEGMVEAAGLAAPIGWSDKPDVEDIFTAMIDHVLSEGEGK